MADQQIWLDRQPGAAYSSALGACHTGLRPSVELGGAGRTPPRMVGDYTRNYTKFREESSPRLQSFSGGPRLNANPTTSDSRKKPRGVEGHAKTNAARGLSFWPARNSPGSGAPKTGVEGEQVLKPCRGFFLLSEQSGHRNALPESRDNSRSVKVQGHSAQKRLAVFLRPVKRGRPPRLDTTKPIPIRSEAENESPRGADFFPARAFSRFLSGLGAGLAARHNRLTLHSGRAWGEWEAGGSCRQRAFEREPGTEE
jgi:hypothetical protein